MKFLRLKFIFAVSFFFVILLFPQTSFAIDDSLGDAITITINYLLDWILSVLNIILALSAGFADSMMQPVSIIHADIVNTGWNITKDFANMFFILILLAIALSFILFPSFQIKKSLPWFLVVALLINFSLPIAGVFLDFANTFTNFFLSQATGNGGLTETIANQLKIADVKDYELGSQVSLDINQAIFKSLLFGLIFSGILTFIFGALGIMFLIRNVYLYILLIILPLVLVASIWPSGKSYFGQWTSSFIKWTFFAPLATFFIYLSLITYEGLTGTGDEFIRQAVATEGIPLLQEAYNYIVILILLIGSLFAASSLGIKGASASMKMLSDAGRAIRGSIYKRTKSGVKSGIGMTARQLKVPEAIDNIAKGTSKIPSIVGGAWATRRLQKTSTKIRSGKPKRAELTKEEKEYASQMSDEQLLTIVKAGGKKAHSYASILAERGSLPEEYVESMYTQAKDFDSKDAVKTITKANPAKVIEIEERAIENMTSGELLKKYKTQNKAEAINKMRENTWKSIKPSDIEKVADGALEGSSGISFIREMLRHNALSSEHLLSAARSGNTAFISAFKNISEGDIKELNPGLYKWLNSSAANGIGIGAFKKKTGDKSKRKKGKNKKHKKTANNI